jgi:hypothetical protein
MRQLNEEEILEAYKKTGFTPVNRTYACQYKLEGDNKVNCACALTTVYVAETGANFDEFLDLDAATASARLQSHFGPDDENESFYGFIDGFDLRLAYEDEYTPEKYSFYDLGRQVYRRLEEQGMRPETEHSLREIAGSNFKSVEG